MNVIYNFGNIICQNDGDVIMRFIAENGPLCVKENGPQIIECFESAFKIENSVETETNLMASSLDTSTVAELCKYVTHYSSNISIRTSWRRTHFQETYYFIFQRCECVPSLRCQTIEEMRKSKSRLSRRFSTQIHGQRHSLHIVVFASELREWIHNYKSELMLLIQPTLVCNFSWQEPNSMQSLM